MKEYTEALGKIINSLKGRNNMGREELARQLAAYNQLLTDLSASHTAYQSSLGRYLLDLARIEKNLQDGRTETAFLSLMISMGSLSAFLGTVMDYSDPRSNR